MSSYKFGDLEIYYAGGEGSPLSSVTGGPVRMEDIRAKYNKGNLFEDPDFPAVNESVGVIMGDSANIAKGATPATYSWQRPEVLNKGFPTPIEKFDFALAQDENMSKKAISEFDIKQGSAGDCWYMASLQQLAKRPDHVAVVIPEDNYTGFAPENYCGAFHFRFFNPYHDKWVDVVIDDRLPCRPVPIPGKEVTFALTFALPLTNFAASQAEYWVPLIEKAYAKFIGSYAKIEGGWSSQGLVNFTGGFGEMVNLHAPLQDFGFKVVQERPPYETLKLKITGYLRSNFFVGVDSFAPESAREGDEWIAGYKHLQVPNAGYKWSAEEKKYVPDFENKGLGLVGPHAYTVLDAKEVKTKDGSQTYFLLQIRNPHAHAEWTGRFSDIDEENWNLLETDLRIVDEKTKRKNIDDGVFWIELADVMKYFKDLECCLFRHGDETKVCSIKGEIPPELVTAQGAEKFTYSPAYLFELKQGPRAKEATGNLAIATMSFVLGEYDSLMKPPPSCMLLIAQIPESDVDLPLDLEKMNSYKNGQTSGFSIGRETSHIMMVEEGTYMVVVTMDTTPKIFADGTPVPLIPKQFEGRPIPFALRVFTEHETSIREMQKK